jgi:hypothetical protein
MHYRSVVLHGGVETVIERALSNASSSSNHCQSTMSNQIRKASSNHLIQRTSTHLASDPSSIPNKRVRVANEKKEKSQKTKKDDQLTFSDEENQQEDNEEDGDMEQGDQAGIQDNLGNSQSSEDGASIPPRNLPQSKEQSKINTMNGVKAIITKTNHHLNWSKDAINRFKAIPSTST